MSLKISIRELRERLPELLDDAVNSGQEYVVQRNGRDYAVIVSALEWRRRTLGRRLDALGPSFQLSPEKQTRIENLLAIEDRKLTPSEQRELTALLRECDEVMLRRARALDQIK